MISQCFLEALLGEKTPPPPLNLATPSPQNPPPPPQIDRSARTTGPPPQLYSIPPQNTKFSKKPSLFTWVDWLSGWVFTY